MLQILPSTLQFENGKATIQLQNLSEAQFVGRLRCTNATAYKYDLNEFKINAHQHLDLPISIEIGRQVESSDMFRVQYYLDDQCKSFAYYQDIKAQTKEAQIRVLLKRHVNVKQEYDGVSTQQQLIQAEDTIQKLSERKNKLSQRLVDARKQTQFNAKKRKEAETEISRLERNVEHTQAGIAGCSLSHIIVAAAVLSVSFLIVARW